MNSEFSNQTWKWVGIPDFCEWSELPKYTKNGKLTMEISIQVHPDSLVGDDPSHYYSRFLVEPPGLYNRIIMVENTRVYVYQEVRFFKDVFFYFKI